MLCINIFEDPNESTPFVFEGAVAGIKEAKSIIAYSHHDRTPYLYTICFDEKTNSSVKADLLAMMRKDMEEHNSNASRYQRCRYSDEEPMYHSDDLHDFIDDSVRSEYWNIN